MKTKSSGFFASRVSLWLAGLALATAPAQAALVPLATGWEYDAPAGFSLINVIDAANITFDVDGTFTGLTPVTIKFKTTANKAQQFFWMGMNVKGNTDWDGFKIQLDDKLDAVAATNDTHPVWAHIHPQASNGGNATDYTPFNTLSATGFDPVATLTVRGGTVTAGNTWNATNIRLHDKASLYPAVGPMEFDMILTPIPEPSTWVVGALLLFAASAFRRLPKTRAV